MPHGREGGCTSAGRYVDDQRRWLGQLDACDKLISHCGVMLIRVVTIGGVENHDRVGHASTLPAGRR